MRARRLIVVTIAVVAGALSAVSAVRGTPRRRCRGRTPKPSSQAAPAPAQPAPSLGARHRQVPRRRHRRGGPRARQGSRRVRQDQIVGPAVPHGRLVVVTSDTLTTKQLVARFAADPRVEYAEPDVRADRRAAPNDPRYLELWGLQQIYAPRAWSVSTGSASVVVASIDSGVAYLHPDLVNNTWWNSAEYNGVVGVDDDGNGYVDDTDGWDAIDEDGKPGDAYGHGTHTAGTIAGIGNNGVGVVGVGWRTKVLPCRFIHRRSGRLPLRRDRVPQLRARAEAARRQRRRHQRLVRRHGVLDRRVQRDQRGGHGRDPLRGGRRQRRPRRRRHAALPLRLQPREHHLGRGHRLAQQARVLLQLGRHERRPRRAGTRHPQHRADGCERERLRHVQRHLDGGAARDRRRRAVRRRLPVRDHVAAQGQGAAEHRRLLHRSRARSGRAACSTWPAPWGSRRADERRHPRPADGQVVPGLDDGRDDVRRRLPRLPQGGGADVGAHHDAVRRRLRPVPVRARGDDGRRQGHRPGGRHRRRQLQVRHVHGAGDRLLLPRHRPRVRVGQLRPGLQLGEGRHPRRALPRRGRDQLDRLLRGHGQRLLGALGLRREAHGEHRLAAGGRRLPRLPLRPRAVHDLAGVRRVADHRRLPSHARVSLLEVRDLLRRLLRQGRRRMGDVHALGGVGRRQRHPRRADRGVGSHARAVARPRPRGRVGDRPDVLPDAHREHHGRCGDDRLRPLRLPLVEADRRGAHRVGRRLAGHHVSRDGDVHGRTRRAPTSSTCTRRAAPASTR